MPRRRLSRRASRVEVHQHPKLIMNLLCPDAMGVTAMPSSQPLPVGLRNVHPGDRQGMSLILVIEDDRIQRQVTVMALKAAGHQVLEAIDGVEGLQMARAQRPDLIVCDVMMPTMNGYQFVTALRDDGDGADIPVIMLTAMTARAHMRTAMTSGADDYIAKPFSFQELNEAVTALLARRQAQHRGFVDAIQADITEAMEEQKQALAGQYERRFMQELNSRWERDDGMPAELRYDDATVVLVNLFGSEPTHLPTGAEAGNKVRQAYQAARDTLYLFRARHILAYGHDLLAIFDDPPATVGVDPKMRAMRAACALAKARSSAPAAAQTAHGEQAERGGIAVALYQGPITLLHVSDPLHGDPDATLATGAALNAATAVREFAQSSQWSIAVSTALLTGFEDQLKIGRRAAISLDPLLAVHEVVELLSAS
jgi:DNA-binding response OmpR family regulator